MKYLVYHIRYVTIEISSIIKIPAAEKVRNQPKIIIINNEILIALFMLVFLNKNQIAIGPNTFK